MFGTRLLRDLRWHGVPFVIQITGPPMYITLDRDIQVIYLSHDLFSHCILRLYPFQDKTLLFCGTVGEGKCLLIMGPPLFLADRPPPVPYT